MAKAPAQQAAKPAGRAAAPKASAKNQPPAKSLRQELLDNEQKAGLSSDMEQYVGKGLEALDQSDMVFPRLKIMQALSPELQTFHELRPGDLLHTATQFRFPGPILVVPIFYNKRYLLWNPRESGGGILARADDGVHWSPPNASFDVKLDKRDGGGRVTWKTAETVQASGLGEWGSSNSADPNSGPAATKMHDYLFGFPEHPDLGPAVFTFQRAIEKVGRNFNTVMKAASQRWPMFGLVFEMTTIDATNSAGQEYKSVQLVSAGRLKSDSPLMEEYRERFDALAITGTIRVRDEESLQDEGGTEDKPQQTTDAKGRQRRKF